MSSLHEMSFFSTSTQGSRLLEPWCDVIGLPIDKVSLSNQSVHLCLLSFLQVNFLFAQLISLPLAFIYRWSFTGRNVSNQTRHLALLLPGLALGYFCFG